MSEIFVCRTGDRGSRGMVGLGEMSQRDEARGLRKEYLRRIDAQAVLDHYGADNVVHRGNEVIHSCLIDRVDPHHMHGDANPSASMNLEKKVYNCYTYGGGDIFWFVTLMEGKQHFHEIVPLLGQFLGDATLDTSTFVDELSKYFRAPPPTNDALPRYHDRVLRQWDNYHPYLRSRGISFEAAERLRIGYDERRVRITIPHWWEGHLVGWQARSLSDPRWPVTEVERGADGRELDGGSIPKYKNSSGFPKDTTLYNYDRVLDRGIEDVVVVESPMSVAMAETHWSGEPDDPFGGFVGTFGSEVNDLQIKALRRFRSVTVWTDPDYAGGKSSYRLLRELYRHTRAFHVQPEEGKDPGDYRERSDAERILNTKRPAVLALSELEKRYGKRKR